MPGPRATQEQSPTGVLQLLSIARRNSLALSSSCLATHQTAKPLHLSPSAESSTIEPPMGTRFKYLVFSALTITVVVVAVEGISYVGLWWLAKYRDVHYRPLLLQQMSPSYQARLKDFLAGSSPISVYSSTLGWEPAPNTSLYQGTYLTNSAGMRHQREFSPAAPDGITRIVSFGDSFTEGIQAANPDTWQEQLMSTDSELEVLNFGVGGYGPDQAYLRYRERVEEYSHHIAMLGYMTENLNRVVNVYIPYYVGERAGAPVTKPRFVLEDDALVLIPNPMGSPQDYQTLLQQPDPALRRLGTHDYYYNSRYKQGTLDFLRTLRLAKMGYYQARSESIRTRSGEYNPKSEAFKVTVAVIDAFYQDALDNDTVPVIVIYPTYWDITGFHLNRNRAYQPILDWLNAGDYLYLDLLEGFVEFGADQPIRTLFASGAGHYSPLGNELVARTVAAFVAERHLKDPQVRHSLIAELRAGRSRL